MKVKYILSIFSGLALTLSSCLGDLNVQPLDENVVTGDVAYSDPASYTKGLMKIYSVWAISGQEGEGSTDIQDLDPGNAQLLRSWWTLQEVTTDECKNAWPDAWVNEINNMTWTNTKNEPIEGVYQRCMFIVALANEYIKRLGSAPSEVNPAQLKAEARFCRALAYYTLLDQYARPPFITESNFSVAPSPMSREELFNWVVTELNDIEKDLPAARQGIYGRADQGAVNALLARIYLNAEVYTGKAMYTECITACNKVIAGGYGLTADYSNLFKADNNIVAKNEIIFPICFDGAATKTWGGMTALICGSRGGGEVQLSTDGVSAGWDGYRSTQNLVNKFAFADNNNRTAANILDKRGIFYSENRSVEIKTSSVGTFTSEGWAVYKFKNVKSDGSLASDTQFPDTDFPMFRLADVYLMYAEAVLRGGTGGDKTTALGYINNLRKRGYGNDSGAITSGQLTTDFILDERSRELYWEGTRRTDLIRYGLYTSGTYRWPFKGGVLEGVAIDATRNLFPIPVTDLSVNGNLSQNPGYN